MLCRGMTDGTVVRVKIVVTKASILAQKCVDVSYKPKHGTLFIPIPFCLTIRTVAVWLMCPKARSGLPLQAWTALWAAQYQSSTSWTQAMANFVPLSSPENVLRLCQLSLDCWSVTTGFLVPELSQYDPDAIIHPPHPRSSRVQQHGRIQRHVYSGWPVTYVPDTANYILL